VLKQVVSGAGSYLGYVYTTDESRAEGLADLAGKSMCYIDLQSTSGYLYPRALLRQKGFDPDHFFGRVEFGGNHLTCLERVLAGQVDASAAYAGAFAFGRSRGLPIDRIRIVGKTQRIPYNALAVRPGLPREVELRLRHELVGLSTQSAAGQRVFSHEARLNAWVPALETEYAEVREVLARERSQGN
ncbi:MAG TPA: PhnD/SsuA/transferrin family substrate-binding protein, partial [Myxococcota bacterium]|nr:PhnD/SsuA/transferrin family substrate-binding protein [Myxococcota bacterium]